MSILAKIASMGIGEICSGVGSLAKDLRTAFTGDMSPDQKAGIKRKLIELELMGQQLDAKTKELQSNVIIAEAKGGSWLQRNWRPLLMMEFGVIIANNYILNPWLSAMFDIDIVMEIPLDMWALLKLGIGGYIVGRSGEKVVKAWKEKG